MNERTLLDMCHTLVEHARKAGADQAEAAAAWQHVVETHVENGVPHTVHSREETSFGLRVIVGSSQGFVTANDVEPDLLAERAAEAVAQARVTPADPAVGLPESRPVAPVPGLYDPEVGDVGAEETARLAGEMLARIRDLDPRVRVDSGSVSASVTLAALTSTSGIVVSEASSLMDASAFGMAVDGDDVASFDYDSAIARRVRGFEDEIAEACARFVSKCTAGLGAGRGESFRGPIVLSPEAVAEFLLPTLISALTADAVRKGRSPLANRIGGSVASPLLSLWDDGRVPGGASSSAFDREGLPTARRALIASGMLQGLLYNHYEARAAGGEARSTGNAVGSVTSLPSVGPHRLEVEPGSTAMDALVDGHERAVWVGRYSGSTNAVTGDFSGVVKNGFLIEAGERRPVREVLIAGNVFELLGRISAISRERRDVSGSVLVPAMRAEDVSITAG
ncbi:MAG TPA: metallopeptidase TldD-related protein [Candidatus Limnocylindrales bacterium]|nr:metallopeptidase TldD-related protein [Candidatus Limnocylindrales bacterium]